MRILVLGTSNSILAGGYVDGLISALPDAEIVNKSVGASPGTQFACYCAEEIGDFDYVLFDSVVNDENQCDRIGDERFFESVLLEIFTTIAAQTRLIVIGFCNERYFDSGSPQQDIHRRCAQKCGAEFLEFREYHSENNLTGNVFQDRGCHIVPQVAFKFGRFVAQRLVSTPRARNAGFPATRKFLTFDASKMCEKSYAKRNRLGEWNFGFMEGAGAQLDMSKIESFASKEYKILGMYIDRHNTNCAIRVASADDAGFVVPLRHKVKNDKVFVVFVPFKDGVSGEKLYVDASSDEPAQGADEPLGETPPGSFRAAISKIVCWRG